MPIGRPEQSEFLIRLFQRNIQIHGVICSMGVLPLSMSPAAPRAAADVRQVLRPCPPAPLGKAVDSTTSYL